VEIFLYNQEFASAGDTLPITGREPEALDGEEEQWPRHDFA
jgi:hypothetical protein